MPGDGETLSGALDSLEAHCRSETRLLYESEGKTDLLGEDDVPGALRTWLQDSRERVLGEGGNREDSQRNLRAQVSCFSPLLLLPTTFLLLLVPDLSPEPLLQCLPMQRCDAARTLSAV